MRHLRESINNNMDGINLALSFWEAHNEVHREVFLNAARYRQWQVEAYVL
ncbi:hypothetical protein Scep_024047 [Stephania cephalantha]|uniref:Uncharacterized protein n=1 Tax=Stephania cephalantha TaxID=152367 RepID=A0AAP0HWS7_9MAGN